MIRAVTFDCAQTLVETRWEPAEIATDAALNVGLVFDRYQAALHYTQVLGSMWGEYQELNQQRSTAVTDDFWRRLTTEWFDRADLPTTHLDAVVEEADRLLFGPDSEVFRLYADVIDTLDLLERAGLRSAVISNWDISLHRVLKMFDIQNRFEFSLASLEEGVEKPDPRLFRIALDRLGLPPEQVLHVGDNPLDDLRGAKAVGMKAVLIDRSQPSSEAIVLDDLRKVAEVAASTV